MASSWLASCAAGDLSSLPDRSKARAAGAGGPGPAQAERRGPRCFPYPARYTQGCLVERVHAAHELSQCEAELTYLRAFLRGEVMYRNGVRIQVHPYTARLGDLPTRPRGCEILAFTTW